MSRSLLIKGRSRGVGVDSRQLQRATRILLQDLLRVGHFDLVIYLVRSPEMARLNAKFLQHEGSTDVITFDYADAAAELHGEIFICYDEAVSHARQFRATLPAELARYVIHGILHLLGHDDARPAARRKMKREENRLLKALARVFPLRKIAGNPRVGA